MGSWVPLHFYDTSVSRGYKENISLMWGVYIVYEGHWSGVSPKTELISNKEFVYLSTTSFMLCMVIITMWMRKKHLVGSENLYKIVRRLSVLGYLCNSKLSVFDILWSTVTSLITIFWQCSFCWLQVLLSLRHFETTIVDEMRGVQCFKAL